MKNIKLHFTPLIFLFLFASHSLAKSADETFLNPIPDTNGIIYVTPTGAGTLSGDSWANATNDLQMSINAVGVQKVFVAVGNYNVVNSFIMKNNVEIYGGFDPENGISTLADNRIMMDASGSTGSILNGQNARRIIKNDFPLSSPLNNTAVLDGFTLLNGYADKGGGIYNYFASPTLINLVLKGNRAINEGGGIRNGGYSSPVLTNVIITEGRANLGGGIFTYSLATLVMTNVVISKNIAIEGGGIFNHNNNEVVLTNVLLSDNTAECGGAVVNLALTHTTMTNVTITRNHSTYFDYNCGSVIYNNMESITDVRNSIIYGNTSSNPYGWTILEGELTATNFAYSLLQGSTDTSNGNIADTDPLFVNPGTGNFRLQEGSPVISAGYNGFYDTGQTPDLQSITTDLDANPRIQNGRVDMGAFENLIPDVFWTTSNNWLNGLEPNEIRDVFIDGNLQVGTDYGSFQAKNLTVEEGGSLTIQGGNAVTLNGKITNNASAESFLVESEANLIQTEDYETDDNWGQITVERESQEIVRLDYTLWSSPVKEQQIQEFSPMTLPNRIYTYETNSTNQESGGAYEQLNDVNTDFIQGKGYLFRAPNDWIPETSETGAIYEGKFVGEPSNGHINVPVFPNGFTSVGNPYPSNINPSKFLTDNPGVSGLFFWNNPQRIYNPETETWGYTGTRYVAYSALGFNNPDYEGKTISTGQGFIVYSAGSSSVNFNNSMRTSDDATFFKMDEPERHRFWLKLSETDNHLLNHILIGYMSGATNGIDQQIEGEQFGYEGSAIYNLIDEQQYAIQGRALPFETDDIVPLGFKAETAGKYTISLTGFEGLFAEGNFIYLKDKAVDVVHNLMDSDYEFESLQGEFKERFEIVYEEEEVLGTDELTGNSIQIYKYEQNIIIESKTDKILSIELYDIQGRNLYRNEKVNSQFYQIPSEQFGSMVLIIKVLTQNGKLETKKLLNR